MVKSCKKLKKKKLKILLKMCVLDTYFSSVLGYASIVGIHLCCEAAAAKGCSP